MANILAETGAITTATRLSKELEKYGCVSSRVIHTPAELRSGGCSYSVKTPEVCLKHVLNISSDNNIKLKKIYREQVENGVSVYYDIS